MGREMILHTVAVAVHLHAFGPKKWCFGEAS
jgi:hypothetical protein